MMRRWMRVGVAAALFVGSLVVAATPAHAAAPVTGTRNDLIRVGAGGFSTPDGGGFWIAYTNGDVQAHGNAHLYGDASHIALNAFISGGASVANGTGYWLDSYDGGIFSYGSARFYGSMGSTPLQQPVFSMTSTKSGKGYWLVAHDGGIFSFGDARFFGSTGAMHLNSAISGITRSLSGNGYRLVAYDGGIFSFGDAPFYGSLPGLGVHVDDVVGMAPTPTNKGYWIIRADGSTYAFGDAHDFGNFKVTHPCDLIAGIFSNPVAQGYRILLGASGATFAVGAAPGGTAPTGTPYDCDTGGPLANPGDVKNCTDFTTWDAANAYYSRYIATYGDVAHLDPNNNGIPCESLPGAPIP